MKIPNTRLREEAAEHELGATNLVLTERADVIPEPIQRQLDEQ